MCFSKLFKKGETNMQYTEKLELNLPEDDDYIESTSREAINDNFEKLDEISPARYIIASYDLTNVQTAFVGGKIDFYNDGTYRAKGTVYAFDPEDLAVGTTVAIGGTVIPTIAIGTFRLPDSCPYSLSSVDYEDASLFPINFDGLKIVTRVESSSGDIGKYIVKPYATIQDKKIRPMHNSAFELCNLTGASITITESDTTKHPKSTYVVEGTYTED